MAALFRHLAACALALALMPAPAALAVDQFFLVAREGPAGSISAEGQGRSVVYLRWGLAEGELPTDLSAYRLLRDGEVVGEWNVGDLMSPAEIGRLYQGTAQRRRLRELVTRLAERAAGEGRDFSAAGFAAELHALLDASNPVESGGLYDPAWEFLGPATDINIAIALRQGWIDENAPPNSTVRYELLGVSAPPSSATATLGIVEVNTAARPTLLAPTNFRQVLLSAAACDLPESGIDHYTVNLQWDPAGFANPTDRAAAQFYLSGLDLYRSTENLGSGVSTAPVRDIAAEATTSPSDARGNPVLAGLEKVNIPLIIDSGASTATPQWTEARDALMRAGLQPGDRRAYYLVPRDFSGQYGPTVATVVVVPLATRPAAPWDVRVEADRTLVIGRSAENLLLRWDAVNQSNRSAWLARTSQICGTRLQGGTQILSYVGKAQNCATDAQIEERVDVSSYLVYRFDSFAAASRFRDSDGDGIGDLRERAAGSQCDASRAPLDVSVDDVRLVLPPATLFTEVQADGREVVSFADQTPKNATGKVFWYRVASRTADGRLSNLSSPQRAVFPDLELPDPPAVRVERTVPGQIPNGCAFELEQTPKAWSFVDEVDPSGAQTFDLSCGISTTFSANLNPAETAQRCEALFARCPGQSVTLTYPATEGNGFQSCSRVLDEKADGLCRQGTLRIVPTFEDVLQTVTVEPGTTIPDATVTITPSDPQNCVAQYQSIDGFDARIGSSCDTGGALTIDLPPGRFCGYAVEQDANNNVSPAASVGCFLVGDDLKPPSPPQVVSLEVGTDIADFEYRVPPEPVALVLARLRHFRSDGSRDATITAIPVAGEGGAALLSGDIPTELLGGDRDRFCLSMLSVGPRIGGNPPAFSDYGAERCYLRRSQSQGEEQFFPWPDVPLAPEGDALNAELVSDFRNLQDFLAIPLESFRRFVGTCEVTELELGFDTISCLPGGYQTIRGALEDDLRVLYFRQRRSASGAVGDWVQIAPLLEYIHWDTLEPKPGQPPEFALRDPFFQIRTRDDGGVDLLFIDRYPYVIDRPGTAYRYEAVYFDQVMRPLSRRRSPWVEVGSP